MDLKRRAIKGAKWITVSTFAATLLNLVKLTVLTRFLEPADFGLMAIAMVVIGFAQAFMDMGISNAIIQRRDVTHSQLSSLYWLNILSGLVVTLTVFGLAPIVSLIYADGRLLAIVMILSFNFVILAAGNQFKIICQREMQFKTISVITTISELTSTVSAITLAVFGIGVFSLVVATIINSLVNSTLFFWIGIKQNKLPSFIFKLKDLNGFFAFGFFQVGEKTVNYFSANIDKLLIGKIVGMQALGYYNIAWQLIIFPLSFINQIVSTVAFPTYSNLQGDFKTLSRFYTGSFKILGLITVPILTFLVFFSKDVILVIFGPGWEQSARLVEILAFVGLLKALGNPGGAIFLALGRADIGFFWNVFWAILVFTGLGVTLSISPQVESAAYALLLLSILTAALWHAMVSRFGNINYVPIVKHIVGVVFFTVLICWGGFLISGYVDLDSVIHRIFLSGIVIGLPYGGYLYFFERDQLLELRK